jgi:hypothetical protein
VRTRNWRLVLTGLLLAVLAAGFFIGMQGMAPRSTDPVELMRTVGQVSGAGGGIGLVMIIIGIIGRRTRA